MKLMLIDFDNVIFKMRYRNNTLFSQTTETNQNVREKVWENLMEKLR